MHMADALISPAVGGTMLAVSAGLVGFATRDVHRKFDNRSVPLMGVMGAFVFAAQMINFTIPGTGSSGHIGGAMLLAALLGPCPAFLVLSGVLMIQALLFADGGLLALGCNIFNLGFWGCFVAYPLIYRPLTRRGVTAGRVTAAAILSCIVSLQLGAFSVVLETLLSGVTELPFGAFVALMQPIHLAIGAMEGVLTALTLLFLYRARPQLLNVNAPGKQLSLPVILAGVALAALTLGGGISLLASSHPDGLEWSIERTAGSAELNRQSPLHDASAGLQAKTALLPDYSVSGHEESRAAGSFAGIAGTLATLAAIVLLGVALRPKRKTS